MKISEEAEEVLEALWICTIESNKKSVSLDELQIDMDSVHFKELLNLEYITLSNEMVSLTNKSKNDAMNVVRRHRLAERLLMDVFNAKESSIHRSACEFEHILHRGIDENVCTLLGHPRFCPHNKPIPIGECCLKAKTDAKRVVSPLSLMSANNKVKISYFQTQDNEKLKSLMAMGIMPGMSLTIIQVYPSYVFKIGDSSYAIDKDIADIIFVRADL